jgi:hypothetical protein
MQRLKISITLLVLAATAACSGGTTNPENPITVGQDDFVTVERDYSGDNYRGTDSASPQSAGTSENAGAAPPADGKTAPQGREGTVEEADIYRVDAGRLFYLNTYRGFIIYDLNDPKNPQKVSRLPVHGYPIEMFVDGNTVYALLRDALYVTQDASGLKFKRHNVSQLVAIDITDLTKPKVVKTIDIVGELKEGVSRKIDDTIYVVSHLPQSYYYRGYPYGGEKSEQAWVYSFNVSNPSDVQLVQKLKVFEGGSYNISGNGSYSGRWFNGVAISATSNTLHVVENWQTYGSVYGNRYSCGQYQSFQEAVVSVIDISDPTGVIRLHSRFSTYGALTDQFKHTYVFDKASNKGYYLGIFARQEWGSVDCSGSQFIQNNIEAWDVTDGANPVRVSSLAFGKPNETVRGSTFDMEKGVAYAITARRVDPLYAIDIKDPKALKVLSAIDGLSGDMNVFRLVNGGKFLIGIGRDNSEDCIGYGNSTVGWATQVAVSLIDVQNSADIKLVQRKCVTVNNAAWTWSEINWNLDQAHKMIGMSSDARANVISVPVNYYAKENQTDGWWWYRPESAVGLMSFDLAAYDSTKLPAQQNVLKNHGTVLHPAGFVKRSIVFAHPNGHRMMVNLSDTHVGVVDIDNLDAPQDQSVIEVAPNHSRLYRFGDYVVDEIQLGEGYYWSQGSSEFRVKQAAPGLDEGTVVASFKQSRVQQVVQFQNLLVMFRNPLDSTTNPYANNGVEAVVMDFSDPANPVQKGTVRLPTNYMPYVWYGCLSWGWWPYYGYGGSWAATDKGLGMLSWSYSQTGADQTLVFLDLQDPANPAVSSRVVSTMKYDSRWGYSQSGKQYTSVVGHPDGLWLNFKEKTGSFTTSDGTKFAVMKTQVERYDDGQLIAGPAVNIPGQAIRITGASGDERFLSSDEVFSLRQLQGYAQSTWMPDQRLHLSARTGANKAQLKDSKTLVGKSVGDMVADGTYLYMTQRPSYYGYYYYGVAESSDSVGGTATESPSDSLSVINLANDKLDERFNAPVGNWGSQLMGIYQQRLFINISGDGMLAVDVSNPDQPEGQHFLRTLGWATHIAFQGDRAFIAAGNFGIYEMDLASAPTILRL